MQRGVVDRVLHMYASPHVVLLLKYILSTTSSQGKLGRSYWQGDIIG